MQAKEDYEKAERRREKARQAGEGTWMLQSVADRIDKEQKVSTCTRMSAVFLSASPICLNVDLLCQLIKALYEWNVTKTNSCGHFNVTGK